MTLVIVLPDTAILTLPDSFHSFLHHIWYVSIIQDHIHSFHFPLKLVKSHYLGEWHPTDQIFLQGEPISCVIMVCVDFLNVVSINLEC